MSDGGTLWVLFSCPRRRYPALSRLPTWAARNQASLTRPQARRPFFRLTFLGALLLRGDLLPCRVLSTLTLSVPLTQHGNESH